MERGCGPTATAMRSLVVRSVVYPLLGNQAKHAGFRAISHRFLKVSVKEALSRHRWVRHITGAHTAPVLCDYVKL